MFKKFVLSFIGKLCMFACFALILFSRSIQARSIIIKSDIYPTGKCELKLEHIDDIGKQYTIWDKIFKIKSDDQKLAFKSINGLEIDQKTDTFEKVYSITGKICILECELDGIMRWGEPGDSDAKYDLKIALEKSLITTLLGLSTL